MSVWATIWTVVFAVTILVYTVLVVIVTLGGWGDIQAMFESLEESSDEDKDKP